MQIRPATPADLDSLLEIDGTIESTDYLHLERSGEGLFTGWKLEPRPLRQKLIESNAMDDSRRFTLKQIVGGIEEGFAQVVEIEAAPVALLLAQFLPERGTLHVTDIRVDYDYRRQGMATVLMLQLIHAAREREVRAVSAETRTNNLPASRMLQKLAFEITGIDTHRHTNHDMVKETATLFWHVALD